jgi:uncharacterized membrane protein
MRNTTRFRPAEVRTAAGFLDQESGSVTIFAIVGFAFCMVIIGLAFDLGRVMGIHTEVSSYADRMALASARELDGRPDALQRAIGAASPGSVVGKGHRLNARSHASRAGYDLADAARCRHGDLAPRTAYVP